MKNREKLIFYGLTAAGCIVVSILGLSLGYYLTNPSSKDQPQTIENNAVMASNNAIDMQTTTGQNVEEKATINAGTEMVYEYIYGDGTVEKTTESAPYFYLNLDEEKLSELLIDWDIVSFDADQVVMQKEMSGESTQHYIIGEKDGYVAVFYETPINGTNLKEITNTPVGALDPEEQVRLEEGIPISGESQLVKAMQDYD